MVGYYDHLTTYHPFWVHYENLEKKVQKYNFALLHFFSCKTSFNSKWVVSGQVVIIDCKISINFLHISSRSSLYWSHNLMRIFI